MPRMPPRPRMPMAPRGGGGPIGPGPGGPILPGGPIGAGLLPGPGGPILPGGGPMGGGGPIGPCGGPMFGGRLMPGGGGMGRDMSGGGLCPPPGPPLWPPRCPPPPPPRPRLQKPRPRPPRAPPRRSMYPLLCRVMAPLPTSTQSLRSQAANRRTLRGENLVPRNQTLKIPACFFLRDSHHEAKGEYGKPIDSANQRPPWRPLRDFTDQSPRVSLSIHHQAAEAQGMLCVNLLLTCKVPNSLIIIIFCKDTSPICL